MTKTCKIETKNGHKRSTSSSSLSLDNLPKKSKLDNPTTESPPQNLYNGWTIPHSNFTLPKISIHDGKEKVTAEMFFQNYVSQRRPVVITDAISINEKDYVTKDLYKLLHTWGGNKSNNNILKQLVGSQKVMVEKRLGDTQRDSYGRGNEIPMLFSEFLNLIEEGDTMHYLTTQDVEANEDGQPDLMAPFMKSLSEYFPLNPKLMGNLIPQNINIWMGNSCCTTKSTVVKDRGSSSGLHHDYHDNLYIVLRGRKRFRLYSPKDTEKMYTRGKLHKVHPNGRINYKGEITTAYGADLQADAAARASKAKDEAEQKLMEAEQAILDGKEGAQIDLQNAEQMLQLAMDALIDAEMDMNNSDDDQEENDDTNEDAENLFTFGSNATFDVDKCESWIDKDEFGDEDDTLGDEKFDPSETSPRLVDKTVKNPDNFSYIEPHLLDNTSELATRFPEILKANNAFCELKVGDMLYLPASWFHEVTSMNEANDSDEDHLTVPKVENDGKPLGHLAFNYWFHPPDNLNNFEHPYTSEFWSNDYKLRFEKK